MTENNDVSQSGEDSDSKNTLKIIYMEKVMTQSEKKKVPLIMFTLEL